MGSWNFPLFTTLAPLVNSIAAGNVTIVKPSEISPHSSKAMKQFINKYLSEAVLCVEGGVEIAKALSSSRFDGLCFTGSTEKGKLVA